MRDQSDKKIPHDLSAANQSTLVSIYSLERQDLSSSSNVTLGLIGAALAYLLAAVFGMG
jgi:hypothetical protein